MSLREENEKRSSQLRKEANLYKKGFKAGLDAAIEAIDELLERNPNGLVNYGILISKESIKALKRA